MEMKTKQVYAGEDSAIQILTKNKAIKDIKDRVIELRLPLGIKLWGAVDYLKTRCGYSWRIT